ncbi:hypothetical protein MTO96_018146 [Rhipicephalus appendiculatus]
MEGGEDDPFPLRTDSKNSSRRGSPQGGKAKASGGEKGSSPGKNSLSSSGSGKEGTPGGNKGASPRKSLLESPESGKQGTSGREEGASSGKSSPLSPGIGKAVASGGEKGASPGKSSLRSSGSGNEGVSGGNKGASPGKISVRSTGSRKETTPGSEKGASPEKSSPQSSGAGKTGISSGEKGASPGKSSLRSSRSGKEGTPGGNKGASPRKSSLESPKSAKERTPASVKSASPGMSSPQRYGIGKAGTSGGDKSTSPGKSSLRSSGSGKEGTPGSNKGASPGKSSLRSSGIGKEGARSSEKGTSPGKSSPQSIGTDKGRTSDGDKSTSPGKSSLRSSGSGKEGTPGSNKGASPGKSSLRSSGIGKEGARSREKGTSPGKSSPQSIGTDKGRTSDGEKGTTPGKSSLRSSGSGKEGTPGNNKGASPGRRSLRRSGSAKEGASGGNKGASPGKRSLRSSGSGKERASNAEKGVMLGSKKSSLRSSGSGKEVAPAPDKKVSDLPQVVEETPEQMALVELAVSSPAESDQGPPSLPESERIPALPGIEERSALTAPLLMLDYGGQSEHALEPAQAPSSTSSRKGTPRSSNSEPVTGTEEPLVGVDKAALQEGEKVSSSSSAISPGPPPSPSKGGGSHVPVIALVVFVVVIVVILILIVLMRISTSPAPGDNGAGSDSFATCESEQCAHLASLLLESVKADSDPCKDFYEYVCGNWKHAGSQSDVLFQKLVDEVTDLIRNVTVPPSGQTPAQKAILAYQACEGIVTRNNTSLATVMRILDEAGLYSPPIWAGPFNALNTTLYLGVRWSIAAPVKLSYAQSTYRGITLRMATSESLKAYVHRRREPNFYDKIKNYYDTLDAAKEDPMIDYDTWTQIDRDVVEDTQQKLKTVASGSDFAGWNESTIQDAIDNVSREQWMSLLRVYFGHYNGSLRFYVDSVPIFRKFMTLPKTLGAEKAKAYLKWYMVEILATKVYAPWVIRQFPTYQEALNYQCRFCFAIVEQTASYALLAPYVTNIFTQEVRDDIRLLLQQVRQSYSDVFADVHGLRSSVQVLPSYSNSTGRIFELLQLSNEHSLEANYARYEDMTTDPLENWRRLVRGRSSSFWSSVSMGTADTLPSDLLYYEVESISHDFSLRPDVAVLPAYDRTNPLLLKLASLGALMASAMAKVLYSAQISKKDWSAAARCILQQNSKDSSETGQLVYLERVIAMANPAGNSESGNGDSEGSGDQPNLPVSGDAVAGVAEASSCRQQALPRRAGNVRSRLDQLAHLRRLVQQVADERVRLRNLKNECRTLQDENVELTMALNRELKKVIRRPSRTTSMDTESAASLPSLGRGLEALGINSPIDAQRLQWQGDHRQRQQTERQQKHPQIGQREQERQQVERRAPLQQQQGQSPRQQRQQQHQQQQRQHQFLLEQCSHLGCPRTHRHELSAPAGVAATRENPDAEREQRAGQRRGSQGDDVTDFNRRRRGNGENLE